MKQVLICMLLVFAVFSCTKDAEHHLLVNFAVLDDETTISTLDKSNVKLSANLSNYGNDEIIDHGFIWGTRITDYSIFTEEKFDIWVNSLTDEGLRKFLLEKGTKISLGKLENPGEFSCDLSTVLGRKYFVVSYITTNKYLLFSKVSMFENSSSPVWREKLLSFQIPEDGQYFSVNDDIYVFYNNSKIGKLYHSDYLLVQRKSCPNYLNTLHFVIGENVYFSMPDRTMWKYATTTDTWTLISEEPDIPNNSLISTPFSINQKGYNCIYDYNQNDYFIFEFNTETNIWMRKNRSDFTSYTGLYTIFTYKDIVYVFDNGRLWYYDENLATLIYKTNIDIDLVQATLTINNEVYFVSKNMNTSAYDIFTYDPDNDETELLCSLHNYFPNNTTIALASNNKIIFLTTWQTCLYELDLSKLK